MIRKLFFVVALVAVAAVSAPQPAPAIDYICSCQVCHGGTSLGCRDKRAPGGWNSCTNWWATYGSSCP
jgi:hypothetical protein